MSTKISNKGLRVGLHLLAWVTLVAIIGNSNITWQGFTPQKGSLQIALAYGFAINAIIFYSNAFWLIPNYLIQKKYVDYIAGAILLIILSSLIEALIDHAYLSSFNRSYASTANPVLRIVMSALVNSFFHFLFLLLSFAYFFPTAWLRNERQKQALIQEKLTAELKYLKNQINPHFLFNGINSVYHLIDGKPNLAKNTLMQLSNLLRYQLYECNDEFIPLSQEMAYLQNYISLEQIRKGSDAKVDWQIDIDKPEVRIAPLLLTPFIENGFKYLSHHLEAADNQLVIRIEADDQQLQLNISNTFDEKNSKQSVGGIGLSNVRRRLELIYPDRYELSTKKEGSYFIAQLKIQLI